MITLASGTRVWLAVGRTDMRKGFDGLSALVQQKLAQDPFWSPVCVSRPPRRPLEGAVVRRARSVPVRQAIGKGPVCLAFSGRRQGGDQPGATGHVA